MPDFISQNEFARRKNVNPSKITKALRSGRIESNAEGKIDWETQSQAWEDNRDPSAIRDTPGSPKSEDSPAHANLAKAKLAKETYTAQLRKLEYEERIGKVVERDQVKSAIFKFTRVVRDDILTIPDRVAAEFTARIIDHFGKSLRKQIGAEQANEFLKTINEADVERIAHLVWNRESRKVLEELDRGPRV